MSTHRVLLIDTVRTNSFKDNLAFYFKAKPNLPAACLFEIDSDVSFEKAQQLLADPATTRHPTNMPRDLRDDKMKEFSWIPFEEEADADIVCAFCGCGGWNGIDFLRLLRCTDRVRLAFTEGRSRLPERYIAVHMRGTDFRYEHKATANVDYPRLLLELFERVAAASQKSGLPVLACTDDREMLEALIEHMNRAGVAVLADQSVFSSSRGLRASGALHLQVEETVDGIRSRNIRTLCDLFSLASAEELFVLNTQPLSGFSRLATRLHQNPVVLRDLLFEDDHCDALIQQT